MLLARSPSVARSLLPLCGVPKKITPAVEATTFFNLSSVDNDELASISLTTMPPRLCAMRIKGESSFRADASEERRSFPWEWIEFSFVGPAKYFVTLVS
jgi:hypothetical protein